MIRPLAIAAMAAGLPWGCSPGDGNARAEAADSSATSESTVPSIPITTPDDVDFIVPIELDGARHALVAALVVLMTGDRAPARTDALRSEILAGFRRQYVNR